MHKERMIMLYAFEQLIINTEDQNENDYYDEQAYGDEDDDSMVYYGQEQYQHLLKMYNSNNPLQRLPNENDYLSNPDDIIDEEDEEDEEDGEEQQQQ